MSRILDTAHFFSCDSKAALQAILNGDSSITQEIYSNLYHFQRLNKTCTLQWVPAHAGIAGNEKADELAKEARNFNIGINKVTLQNANAITNSKLREISIPTKHQLCIINKNRLTTNTIVRFRTKHHRGMKIDREGKKVYRICDNCPDTQLTPDHVFDCPVIRADLRGMGVLPSLVDLYAEKIEEIAAAVVKAHGYI